MPGFQEYAVRLALAFLNERYRTSFAPAPIDSGWLASDPEFGDITVVAAGLFETTEAYAAKAKKLEERLDARQAGSYLLWVPPGAELPEGEPYESDWLEHVVQAASRLASGRTGEALIPVQLALGKVREEGGYASVTGGLGRFWTHISDKLEGSFYLDTRALHRFTRDEESRQKTYEQIAELSRTLSVGQVEVFLHGDAWTVQRLARGPAAEGMTDGWVIGGAPEGFDPADGGAVRRVLRRRLSEAKEVFSGLPRPWILVLAGCYDYMELENAGPSLRGFDPGLTAFLDGIILVADGEVKPILLNRSLSFIQ